MLRRNFHRRVTLPNDRLAFLFFQEAGVDTKSFELVLAKLDWHSIQRAVYNLLTEHTLNAAYAACAEGMGTPIEDAGKVGFRIVVEADRTARVAHRK